MKHTYHQWRVPLPVNSNWWLAFVNDPNLTREADSKLTRVDTNFTREPERDSLLGDKGWVGITPWQIRRAAWLIWRILDFKERLDR